MLRVEKINVFYGKIQVLWDVSFAVDQGEIVVILGSNGAGKSTMLNTLAGLIAPRSGAISYLGDRLDRVAAHRIVGRSISLVPEGASCFPKMSIAENLEVGAFQCRDRRQVRQSLEWVCERFPVLGRKYRQQACTLSGGERQMLAIGRALMNKPKLLMLDEPSYGLAPLVVAEVFEQIKTLRQSGTSILVVEQSSKHALMTGDRGYLLENGRIVLQDTCDNLKRNEHVKKAYLGL